MWNLSELLKFVRLWNIENRTRVTSGFIWFQFSLFSENGYIVKKKMGNELY